MQNELINCQVASLQRDAKLITFTRWRYVFSRSIPTELRHDSYGPEVYAMAESSSAEHRQEFKR